MTAHENQEAAHLEKLRADLTTDMEAMQQKEASLREYEQRLRMLVDHAQQPQPQHAPAQYLVTNGADTRAIEAEWEKYNRAHALLEAARRGLADDRLALKDREERVQAREIEVARREAWVKLREQELTAAVVVRPEVKARPSFVSAPLRHLFSRSG